LIISKAQNFVSASIGGILNLLSIVKGFPNKHEVDIEEVRRAQEKESQSQDKESQPQAS